MGNNTLESKIDTLIEELKSYVESQSLSDYDLLMLNTGIDKLLNECLQCKSKIVC